MFVKTIANNVKHDKCSTKVGESITFQFLFTFVILRKMPSKKSLSNIYAQRKHENN